MTATLFSAFAFFYISTFNEIQIFFWKHWEDKFEVLW